MVTDGSDFKGERLTVQFARGPRRKENLDRPSVPRPRRTIYRMQISGLPETSWQVSSPCPFIPGSLGFALFGPYENPSFHLSILWQRRLRLEICPFCYHLEIAWTV